MIPNPSSRVAYVACGQLFSCERISNTKKKQNTKTTYKIDKRSINYNFFFGIIIDIIFFVVSIIEKNRDTHTYTAYTGK